MKKKQTKIVELTISEHCFQRLKERLTLMDRKGIESYLKDKLKRVWVFERFTDRLSIYNIDEGFELVAKRDKYGNPNRFVLLTCLDLEANIPMANPDKYYALIRSNQTANLSKCLKFTE